MSVISWFIGVSCVIAVLHIYVTRVIAQRYVIRNAQGEPYLIRYFLWKPEWVRYLGLDPRKCGRIYLHHILQSDHDRALHDHPWPFISFILRGGYVEYADSRDVREKKKAWQWTYLLREQWDRDKPFQLFRRFNPGAVLYRPAHWRHRLEVSKPAWTLVFIGPVQRRWGFWTSWNKWCHHSMYDTATAVCLDGQEEPAYEGKDVGVRV